MIGTVFESVRHPMGDARGLERALAELFGERRTGALRSSGPGSFPAVNVGVTPEAVHVYALASGLDPTKLEVNVQAGALSISGSRAAIGTDGARRYYRQERFGGDFGRVVALPDDVDGNRVDASYANGVLHVTLARREETRARQIPVK